MDNQTWFDAYTHHFLNKLGVPSTRRVYKSDKIDYPFAMLIYQARNGFVFCSCGISMYWRRVGSICEVCCPVLVTDSKEIETILAIMLEYAVSNPAHIHPGVAFPGLDGAFPAFYAKYAKSAIYFSDLQPDYETLSGATFEGQLGDVYQATFITSEEYNFLIEHGHEAFESLLQEKEVIADDLSRSSAV